MNGNTELLNFVYQNSGMGTTTIHQLLDITQDDVFKQHLQEELLEYNEIHMEAKQKLNENGCDEKGLSALEKLKTYLMISVQTLTNKSTPHIAEMMITGSNMGILDATKNLKKYVEAEKDIVSLMKRLLKFEENNVQRLKDFL